MIIVDIDDTVLRNGTQPIKKNIDYINSLPGKKVVVTGRTRNQRTETIAALHNAGLHYSSLLMNPYTYRDSNKWKREVAHKLNDATLAIDNDSGARAAYSSAGIKTMDPATIPNVKKLWNLNQ